MERASILGVPVDCVTRQSALQALRGFLDAAAFHHVATPNNEMIVAAQRLPQFHALLRRTALNLPDSTGVVWASRLCATALPERVTGVDTVTALCDVLDAAHPVFLLGAAPGVAERAAAVLRLRNPRLVVAGVASGSPADADAPGLIAIVQASGAHLLLVAFGSPAQELWIDAHRDALPTVRVAIGVGGTFDFLAGTRSRAPRWMQSVGLEWCWRLLQEPRRIGRILTAVVVFPWMVLTRRPGRAALP